MSLIATKKKNKSLYFFFDDIVQGPSFYFVFMSL